MYLSETLFEIQNILDIETVSGRHNLEYLPEEAEESSYLRYSHIFNLIIYYLLVQEKYPLEIDFKIKQIYMDKYRFSYYPKKRCDQLCFGSIHNHLLIKKKDIEREKRFYKIL